MAKIGYFLSCEEFGPNELIEQAKMAEAAGFEALWISDHFHPWTSEQGNSPFVWSVIGGLSQATSLPVTTGVTCPTMRIHPAIIAQAAVTSAVMLGGRFSLGVEPDPDVVGLFRSSGGGDKPAHTGTKVCFMEDEAAAHKTAHRLWANEQLPGELAQELPTPQHFEQATSLVTEEMVAEAVVCGPDPERHVENIRQAAEADYDEVYVQQIGPEQETFFRFYEKEVLPGLR